MQSTIKSFLSRSLHFEKQVMLTKLGARALKKKSIFLMILILPCQTQRSNLGLNNACVYLVSLVFYYGLYHSATESQSGCNENHILLLKD